MISRLLHLADRLACRVLAAMLRAWNYALSPLFGDRCRFHPSCSRYAVEALERHGLLRGSWLTLRRVVRCQPWCDGGVDPVPESASRGEAAGPRTE
ncbi:MAG: membrane protein insertion efficiency factor YidD [Bdellovibrionales bacterium]|nr:membrane protein insertion efficiency factor YidD [Bdellovibrionales bacterium]